MQNLELLVHITFHYSLPREKYLLEVLQNFQFYKLKKIKVVIDSNTEETQARLKDFIESLPFIVEIHCHRNLRHPFALTWTHRQHMLEQFKSNNFDLFMYLEDDILIPWDNFKAWLTDNEQVYRAGYLRGFLRVEKSEDGTLYSVDFSKSMSDPIIFKIGDKYYFQPDYPYHACWVYNRKQMHNFIKSRAWIDEDGHWGMMRERAAFGMIWVTRFYQKIVLPVESNGAIPLEALNYHLSKNYYCDPNSPFAKIPINKLLEGEIISKHSLYGFALYYYQFLDKILNELRYTMSNWWSDVARRAIKKARERT